jgi:hypothetical protein
LDAQFAATTTAPEAEPTLEMLQLLQQLWQTSGCDSLVEHVTHAAGGQRLGRGRALCAVAVDTLRQAFQGMQVIDARIEAYRKPPEATLIFASV